MISKVIFVILIFSSVSVKAEGKLLLVLGDSLSAGYGIPLNSGWVAKLQDRLNATGYRYNVINASISGDTTRGARTRLDNLLLDIKPSITIVELGGNDGLRGISLDEMYTNLQDIINLLTQSDSRVLLVPIKLPPNYGQTYIAKFMEVYTRLSTLPGVITSKFILEGIADNPELMQGDGIHPVAAAQQLMLENIWQTLEPMLEVM